MIITKKPEKRDNYYSRIFHYDSARKALEDVLLNLMKCGITTVFLPAFIGYSPKEGSGIFDPVLKTGIGYDFYGMTENLHLDLEDIKNRICNSDKKVAILLVHYWGYIDPNYEEIAKFCKSKEVVIIEDSAHALFTEVCGQTLAGKYADYIIYSLHKMFPINSGGALRVLNGNTFDANLQTKIDFNIFEYDIVSISEKRKSNACFLENKLKDNPKIKILRSGYDYEGNVPQTFPILLDKAINRYNVYLKLNEMGYGVISLYHTLIQEIMSKNFYSSEKLSSGILNLPVHQDVSEETLEKVCESLIKIIDNE